ncbi:MAG: HEAT repeat domain-containing protein [Bdellovibrionales bacterium]
MKKLEGLAMIKMVVIALMFGSAASASVGNSFSLNKGRKHPLFKTGESTKTLEQKVFSEDVSFEKRWKLVDQVADLKQRVEAIVFLKKCLSSKEWFLQSAALKVLKNRYPDVAIKLAEKTMFNSQALVVRSEAVEVISALGGPKDTDKLWKALGQRQNFKGRKSLWIRPQIVKSIFKLERSKHSDRWEELLTDSNKEIRGIAKKVVGVN